MSIAAQHLDMHQVMLNFSQHHTPEYVHSTKRNPVHLIEFLYKLNLISFCTCFISRLIMLE